MHLSLEPLVKKELNKILVAKKYFQYTIPPKCLIYFPSRKCMENYKYVYIFRISIE